MAFADCGPAVLERATVEHVSAEGDIRLGDGRNLRLAGLHLVSVAAQDWPKAGEPIAFGVLSEERDRWGRLPAIVFTGADSDEWLQQVLLARGAALARPEPGLDGCWPLLAQAEAETEARLPATAVEGGRFARVSGRVGRVGEGRSAHFITVFAEDGSRVTGLVQKRHVKRLKDSGVDVVGLRGQWIRLRGVRNAPNSAVIPVMMAEQIEILR